MNLTEAKEDILDAANRFRQLAKQCKRSPQARHLLNEAAEAILKLTEEEEEQ